jgi:quercetin 2,3-dioxygenase
VSVLETVPLGPQWPTIDPFLFCAHHDDAYPAGNDRLGPAASLAGRDLGMDFAGKDGWRMYHGSDVPGFPQHPHRGFETVTIVRRGFIDHSDSLGATARFGQGDVQWLTAGRGISHCEMFPLVDPTAGNPLELFQIWLNLPAKHKLVAPYFTMLWDRTIPRVEQPSAPPSGGAARSGEAGPCGAPGVLVRVVAGQLADVHAPAPPPDSWAAHDDAAVGIWTVTLAAGARWTLPPAAAGSQRTLYVFAGNVAIAGHNVFAPTGARVDAETPTELVANVASELLVLQGRPIGEPVAHHGPFVMNTRAELQQAFLEYQATRFGGWPWPSDAPVHARDAGRFAKHPDGRIDRP